LNFFPPNRGVDFYFEHPLLNLPIAYDIAYRNRFQFPIPFTNNITNRRRSKTMMEGSDQDDSSSLASTAANGELLCLLLRRRRQCVGRGVVGPMRLSLSVVDPPPAPQTMASLNAQINYTKMG
jgi:hypothetical protein